MLIRWSLAWNICRKCFVERIKTMLYKLQTKIPLRKQHPLLLFSNASERFIISLKIPCIVIKKENSSYQLYLHKLSIYTCIQFRNTYLTRFSTVLKINTGIVKYKWGQIKLYICSYGTFCYVTLLWIVDFRCFKI